MSHFHEQFSNHAVHKSLSGLTEQIEAFNLEIDSPKHAAIFARFRKVVDFAQRTIEAIDCELVTPQLLSQIQGGFDSMKGALNQLESNKDWNALTAQGDQLLSYIGQLPHYKFSDAETAYKEAMRNYQMAASEYLKDVEAKAGNQAKQYGKLSRGVALLSDKLKEYDQQFEQQKSRVDDLITQQQSSFAKTQENRQATFDGSQAKFVQENNDRITQLEQQLAQNREDADKNIAALQEANEQEIGELQEKFNDVLTQQEKQVAKSIDDLNLHLKDAERIVGLIGNTGLTGNYQRIANEQCKLANLFRWIAIGCMGVAAIFVLKVLSSIGSGDQFNWEVGLFRLLGVLPFSILGWYCGRESSRHRATEKRNRQHELELAALNPYLAEITDEERKKIIAELAPQYFGQEVKEDDEHEIFRKVKHLKGDDILKMMKFIAKVLKP